MAYARRGGREERVGSFQSLIGGGEEPGTLDYFCFFRLFFLTLVSQPVPEADKEGSALLHRQGVVRLE